jgi:hypothetical protein
MTHKERIVFCKTCEHKKVDYHRGIVCELTEEVPDFEGTCPTYKAIQTNSSAYSPNINIKQATPLKPNNKRAAYTIYAMYANLILASITLIALLNESRVMKNFMLGTEISDFTYEMTDFLTIGAAILKIIVLISSAVFFIMWFRRAYYNLHLRESYCNYSEAQAAWSWFVPILSLFRPNEIMREMVERTSTMLNLAEQEVSKTRNIVLFWWMTWVIQNIASQIITRMYKVQNLPEEIIKANNAELAVLPIEIIAAVLAILVVKRYSKMEDQLMLRDNASDELDQIGINSAD